MIKKSLEALMLGSTLKPKQKKEADSGSSMIALLRNRESASLSPKSKKITIRSRLSEAKASPTVADRFQVILIQEGLGNLGDCFYYTKQALQGAVSIFEGAKCFADHPSSIEEEVRPERSTRDILGYFEGVSFQQDSDGRGMLVGTLNTVEDASFNWAKALLTNSISYAQKYQDQKDFVGLSINAEGEAQVIPIDDFLRGNQIPSSILPKIQKAQEQGVTDLKVVQTLKNAISCDLVTEAGAGGRILKMVEQERNPMRTDNKKTKESKEQQEADMEKKAQENDMDGQDDGSDDSDQDQALFKKMISQYLGDEMSDSEEAMDMAKEAYEAHKEEGMEKEAAYEAAGQHLKMAMKIGQKMKQKKEAGSKEDAQDGGDSDQAPAQKGAPAKKQAPAPKGGDDSDSDGDSDDKDSQSETKESKTIIRLSGENLKLKEALKKYELNDYIKTKMIEDKRSLAFEKKFREAIVKPRSQSHVDESYKLFSTAIEGKFSDEAEGDFSAFVSIEKNPIRESNEKTKMVSFVDCLE